MPGRNAASARPDRTAKNAAIAVAKTAPATCDERRVLHHADHGEHDGHTERRAGGQLDVLLPRPERDEDHRGQRRLERAAPAPQGRREPVSDQGLDRLGRRQRGDPGNRSVTHVVGTIS